MACRPGFNKMSKSKSVDHPSHYNKGIEAIDFIESWSMDFNTGNAIKYLCRYKHKNNPLEDLEKAKWYVERIIQNLTKENTSD